MNSSFLTQLRQRCPTLLQVVPEQELSWLVQHLPQAPQKLLYRLSEAAALLSRSENTLIRWATERGGGVYGLQRDFYGRYVMHRKQVELIASVEAGFKAKEEADIEWGLFCQTQGAEAIISAPRRRTRNSVRITE